mgnify:CR=1 FL=1
MDVLEAEGKEVLETIILKQEIEQLYRAYEACLKGNRENRLTQPVRAVWRKGTDAAGDCRQTWDFAFLCEPDREAGAGKNAAGICGTQIKNRKSGWQMLGWTSVSRFCHVIGKFSGIPYYTKRH